MIRREYYQNINVYAPRDYFERWYADLWNRRIGRPTAPPGTLAALMTEELALIGASVRGKDTDYRFIVTFEHDRDYTAFVLRWS
jgi:hypothetical protein